MKKHLLLSLIVLIALGCSVEDVHEIQKGDPNLVLTPEVGEMTDIDQRVFELLDLDRPGLEDVKRFYQAGQLSNAASELLTYYRERPVYNPGVNMLQPSATATELKIADQATKEGDYRFKVYEYVDSDGNCYSFKGEDGTIDWSYIPEAMKGEKEFMYQLHRHQWMLPQAKAYKATGEEKHGLTSISAGSLPILVRKVSLTIRISSLSGMGFRLLQERWIRWIYSAIMFTPRHLLQAF